MVRILTADGEIHDGSDTAQLRRFVLIVDVGGSVVSAAGAHRNVLGYDHTALERMSLAELLHEESRIFLSEITYKAALRESLGPFAVFLEGAEGRALGCRVEGRPAASAGEAYRLEFEFDPALERSPKPRDSKEELTESAARAMAMHADRELGLTFVELGDVGVLGDNLGLEENRIDGFRRQVRDRLERESLENSVSEVDSGKYGLVHDAAANLTALHADLQGYAASLDPDGKALAVRRATVALAAGGLDPEQVESAIAHAIDGFAAAGLDSVIFETLEDSHAAWLDRRADRTEMLRDALARDRLRVVFRPVVVASSWSVDHLLAELRADLDEDGLGVEEIVSLTRDDAALRTEVDKAQCRCIFSGNAPEQNGVAISLAIRSLLDPWMLPALLDFARDNPECRIVLRFEGLTPGEASRVAALQVLRDAGFGVALLGKEVGAVTEQALAALPADYLILDPSFAVDSETLGSSMPVLAGLVGRCRDKGKAVLFEGVASASAVRLIAGVRGALVSGPYFGEPVPSPDKLRLPRPGR